MSLILTIVLLAAMAVLFASVLFVSTTTTTGVPSPEQAAELSLERIQALLIRGDVDGSYATFLFYPDDLIDRHDPPSFQLTHAGGRICVDWALTSARSIRDRKRFDAYARVNAATVSRQIGHNGAYVRVIAEDPAAFCRSMLLHLYGIDEGDRLVMIFHGVDWSALPPLTARAPLTIAPAPRADTRLPTLR